MRRRQTPGMEDFKSHLDTHRNLIERRLYHRQIAKYLEFFPREQCRIWIDEEMTRDPTAFFAELCRFIGVDGSFKPKSLFQRIAESLFYRVGSPIINLPVILPIWRYLRRNTRIKEVTFGTPKDNGTGSSYHPLSREERNDVEQLFADENRQLFALLGRDISAWRH
jgi:hypothetical protein